MSRGLSGARVLVTGATGFIGSRLARFLHEEGANVHILARRTSSRARLEPLWDALTCHTGDLEDVASLQACVAAARPQYVFHLAKDRDGTSFERETAATLRLADALRRAPAPITRWVRTAHAASERYGRGGDRELARALSGRLCLPVVTLELFFVYGPGQDADDFPRSAVLGKPGADEGWKDFVHVDDVARAYLLAAVTPKAEGQTVPIGSGVLRSAAEIRALLKGKALRAPQAPPSDAGHPADLALSRTLLGWEPRVDLAAGLAALASGEARG